MYKPNIKLEQYTLCTSVFDVITALLMLENRPPPKKKQQKNQKKKTKQNKIINSNFF